MIYSYLLNNRYKNKKVNVYLKKEKIVNFSKRKNYLTSDEVFVLSI